MEPLTVAIARALRMELARRDMTAAEFAAHIGASKSNVSRWTNGEVDLRTSRIDMIAHGLDMTTLEFIALAEEVRQDAGTAPPVKKVTARPVKPARRQPQQRD